jgi:mRNA interferase RelE/StbE
MRKLTPSDRARIFDYLTLRANDDLDPRHYAKRLAGQSEPLWRFRVGNFRIIVSFEEKARIIIVIGVGNRRDVYR